MRVIYIQHPMRFLDSVAPADVFVGEFPRFVPAGERDLRQDKKGVQGLLRLRAKKGRKRGSRRKSLLAAFLMFAVLAWSSSLMSAFEAHVIGVTATIVMPEEPQPECDNPGLIEINDVEAAQYFDFTGYDVIVRKGGELRPEDLTIPMTITTNCDFTIDPGGSIRAENPRDAEIFLTVGGDLVIDGKMLVRGGRGSGENLGGIIHFNAGGDFRLRGMVNTSAQETGGKVEAQVGGDMEISEAGKLIAGAGAGTGVQEGGIVSLIIQGDFEQRGKIAVSGDEEGGKILVKASSISYDSGMLNARGGSGSGVQTGGIVELMSASGDVVISANINTSAQEGAGRIYLSSARSMFVTAGKLKAESANGSGNQSGGVVVIEAAKDVMIGSVVSAKGDENGGDISVKGGNAVTITGDLNASGGRNGPSLQSGGTITVETPAHLAISGKARAVADDFDGIITLRYCTDDFSGADFNPLPIEEPACAGTDSLTAASGSETPAGSSGAASSVDEDDRDDVPSVEASDAVAETSDTQKVAGDGAGDSSDTSHDGDIITGISATSSEEIIAVSQEDAGGNASSSAEVVSDEADNDTEQEQGDSKMPGESVSGAPDFPGINPPDIDAPDINMPAAREPDAALPAIEEPDINMPEVPSSQPADKDVDGADNAADAGVVGAENDETMGRDEDSTGGEIVIERADASGVDAASNSGQESGDSEDMGAASEGE